MVGTLLTLKPFMNKELAWLALSAFTAMLIAFYCPVSKVDLWCIPSLGIHSTPSDSPKGVGAVSVVVCIRHNQCEDIKKVLVRHMKIMTFTWYPVDFYVKIMNLGWSFVFWLFNPNSNSAFKDFSITATISNICSILVRWFSDFGGDFCEGFLLLRKLVFSCNHRFWRVKTLKPPQWYYEIKLAV